LALIKVSPKKKNKKKYRNIERKLGRYHIRTTSTMPKRNGTNDKQRYKNNTQTATG
jgi:hypothetical protein